MVASPLLILIAPEVLGLVPVAKVMSPDTSALLSPVDRVTSPEVRVLFAETRLTAPEAPVAEPPDVNESAPPTVLLSLLQMLMAHLTCR